MKFNYCSNNLY